MNGRQRGLIAVTAAALTLAFAPSAQAAPSWKDGLVQKSTVTNCQSIIFGSPIQEDGAWTWTGQYVDPGNLPGINETFYVHVVVGAVGNPCPGGQYAHFEFIPPSGVSLAIDGTHPVFCWAINWNNSPATAQQEPAFPTGACPQAGAGGGFGNGPSFDAQTSPTSEQAWPMAQGYGWEIQIPVRSNRVLNGGFGACGDCQRFLTYVIDGNSSPQLFPSQGLFVDNSGGGSNTPGGGGGTGGAGGGLRPTPPPTRPTPPAATPASAPAPVVGKKCKKKKGRAAVAKKKKCKR